MNGASMTFTLNSTNAFALFGSVNYNHGTYSVNVTSSLGSVTFNTYNGSSRWTQIGVVKYFQSGMDPTQTYTVEIVDEADEWFDVANIVVYNAPSGSAESGYGFVPVFRGLVDCELRV